MQKKVLFIDTAHPILAAQLNEMGFQTDYFPDYSYVDYCRIMSEYEGVIIRSKVPLNAGLLRAATSLKFIARVGAGMENIDTETAEALGIICLNAPEGNRNAVAEHALGMLLALMNHLLKVDAEVRNGIWIRAENRGFEVKGKTIGILGYGNTGSSFAKKLQGFEATILAYDKYKSGFGNEWVTESGMDQIFEEADIVSLHLPLTDETQWLVDSMFLGRFSKPIYLINTSRGQIVRTADLVEALRNKTVSGACLDVLEFEKFSFEDIQQQQLPQIFQELLRFPNVLLSPHIAGWTHESHRRMAEVLIEKIRNLYT